MNIALISACSDHYRALGRISIPTKERYAQLHGYTGIFDTFQADRYTESTGKHPSWYKILAILTRIHLFQWIWWSDADTIIAHPAIRIEDMIDENASIIAGRFPLHARGTFTIHTGNFLISCSAYTRDILMRIYYGKDYARFNMSAMREEDALIHLLTTDPGVRSTVTLDALRRFSSWPPLPGVAWNQDWEPYKPGDFIIHAPSPAPLETRVDLLREYRARTRSAWL